MEDVGHLVMRCTYYVCSMGREGVEGVMGARVEGRMGMARGQ